MADPGDLSKNPFTALFPSVDVAEQYSAESGRKYGENKQSGRCLLQYAEKVMVDIR